MRKPIHKHLYSHGRRRGDFDEKICDIIAWILIHANKQLLWQTVRKYQPGSTIVEEAIHRATVYGSVYDFRTYIQLIYNLSDYYNID